MISEHGIIRPVNWALMEALCFPGNLSRRVVKAGGQDGLNYVSIPKSICWTPNSQDHTKAFDCVDHNKLWTILKEMGIPDPLICLLRNLYAGQEATVRTGHGTTDWFQGEGVRQGCILSPCLFNLYAEYIMRNAGLEETQAGEISVTSDMQMTPPLWQKVKRN